MRALVFDGRLRFAEKPRVSRPGECLIRVLKAGICNTDLEITAGYLGFTGTLGHEFVGIVEDGPPAWRGKRVVGEINVGCGACALCRQGLGRHCPNRTTLGILGRDGALAETCSLPAANLHEVPTSVPDTEAVFVEPLAAACEILEQVHLEPDRRICIIGDGKLGLLIARVLRLTGAPLTLVGHHTEKMALLPDVECVLENDFRPARDFDVVVEASGAPAGWRTALRAIRPRGTLILKSTYAGSFDFNPAPLVIDELRVLGSRCGCFAPALRLLASRLVRVDDMITAEFPFREAVTAFAEAAEKHRLKVVLDMG